MTDVRVPTLGESVTEATVATWFKQPGDKINMDEMLCYFVGFKFTEHFIHIYFVTRLLKPSCNCCFCYAFAKSRNPYIGHFLISFKFKASSTSDVCCTLC